MHRKLLFPLVFSCFLYQNGISQIKPVITPVANIPRISIPVTLTGKVKIVDSLKKANVNAGAILKAFLPQYTTQFQDQLVEQLIILRHAGFTSDIMAPAVIAEYPNITKPVLYKIFFAYGHRIAPWLDGFYWPWDIEGKLNAVYGVGRTEPTAIKLLREANVGIEVVFAYYGRLTNELTIPNCWKYALGVETIPENWQIKYTLYSMLRAGYSAAEIYECMKKYGYRSDYWLVGFCNAGALTNTPVETVARLLKADYIYGEELTRILKLSSGYNSAAEILKALQAN